MSIRPLHPVLLVALVTLAFGCASSDDPVEAGRRVYAANCTVCHNPDPTVAGSLGPAIAGSSRALIEARVMRAEYPPGYTPRQDTKIMVALPFLKDDIDELAAYLGSVGR